MREVAGDQAGEARLQVDLEGVLEALGDEGDALAVGRPGGALAEAGELGDVRWQVLLGRARLLALGGGAGSDREEEQQRQQRNRASHGQTRCGWEGRDDGSILRADYPGGYPHASGAGRRPRPQAWRLAGAHPPAYHLPSDPPPSTPRIPMTHRSSNLGAATLLLAVLHGTPAGAQRPGASPSFAEPGISPDGAEVAFASSAASGW